MPIKIPNDLPASHNLAKEGVLIMRAKDAIRQDIRPLQIGLLNLMPLKEATELQLARLLGATPLQVELTLITTGSYNAKNAPEGHMQKFYQPWHKLQEKKFDGFIITGAPVEQMEFTNVAYWQEMTEILNWTQTHVFSTFAICWGAQAALFHHRRIDKHTLPKKAFGLYQHRVLVPNHPLVRGFNDHLLIPVSRHTGTEKKLLPQHDPNFSLLLDSAQIGVGLIADVTYRTIYMFNHLEYDTNTLAEEYQRDRQQHLPIDEPYNYFEKTPNSSPPNSSPPNSSPPNSSTPNSPPITNQQPVMPLNLWRAHAHLLFHNWINEVYQHTPFDLNQIGTSDKK